MRDSMRGLEFEPVVKYQDKYIGMEEAVELSAEEFETLSASDRDTVNYFREIIEKENKFFEKLEC